LTKLLIKKLHPDAVIPTQAHPGDAGYDLTAVGKHHTSNYIEYSTGLAVVIPEGHVGLLFPRSSLSEYRLRLTNSVGVLDSGYRGEITFRYALTQEAGSGRIYGVGDRIGQLVIIEYKSPQIETVTELPVSKRGKKGYGSTGA